MHTIYIYLSCHLLAGFNITKLLISRTGMLYLTKSSKMLKRKDRYLCVFYASLILSWGLDSGSSCIQNFCSCDDETTFCSDVITPSLMYRPTVTRLYMESVHILGMGNIFSSSPSLYYLTLCDMLYFDCNCINDMPQQIKLLCNMCQFYRERSTSTLGE